MSSVMKFEDYQPAVSLILVKPAAPTSPTAQTETSDMSRAAAMQLIFELMLLIGKNMAQMQQITGESQVDTAKIAQDQAIGAAKDEHDLIKEFKKLHKEQQRAARWHVAEEVLKWTAAGIALTAGALLCETPIGFMILAATIAFTASPLFNMSTNIVAKGFEDLGIPKSWATIMAQIAIVTIITVVSFGTEAATVGTRVGIVAVDDAAETSTTVSEAEEDEVEQEVMESTETKNPTQSYRTSATTLASLQVLMSSGIIPESISKIPGINRYPWLAALLTILTEIVVSVAAMKVTPTSGLMDNLPKLTQNLLNMGRMTLSTASSLGTDIATMYTGYNELEQSKVNKKIAPLQSMTQFKEGFVQILTQLSSLSQQSYTQTMNANETIFRTDFASDMEACVRAQQQF